MVERCLSYSRVGGWLDSWALSRLFFFTISHNMSCISCHFEIGYYLRLLWLPIRMIYQVVYSIFPWLFIFHYFFSILLWTVLFARAEGLSKTASLPLRVVVWFAYTLSSADPPPFWDAEYTVVCQCHQFDLFSVSLL